MKVWHLDREYDAFIAAVAGTRQRRKAGVRDIVDRHQGRCARKGRRGPGGLRASTFDGWTSYYPLKVGAEELESAASSVGKEGDARTQGHDTERDALSSLPEAHPQDLQEKGAGCGRGGGARGEGPRLRSGRNGPLSVEPRDGRRARAHRRGEGDSMLPRLPTTAALTPTSPPPRSSLRSGMCTASAVLRPSMPSPLASARYRRWT